MTTTQLVKSELINQQILDGLAILQTLPASDQDSIALGVQCLPKEARPKAAIGWALRWKVR